jgi:hypothetical protein
MLYLRKKKIFNFPYLSFQFSPAALRLGSPAPEAKVKTRVGG